MILTAILWVLISIVMIAVAIVETILWAVIIAPFYLVYRIVKWVAEAFFP